ncbi:GGDEF domain-containing protein [Azohydromonas lata]|uniref:GGDEF domain-containing protein n=1 Tax=Azohydromonas lata TaxID=45677 RepID=UPI000830ED5C|nr:GGDEF domain-containing protein [Azohydromonas lata]
MATLFSSHPATAIAALAEEAAAGGVLRRFERLQRVGMLGFIALLLVLAVALLAALQGAHAQQLMQVVLVATPALAGAGAMWLLRRTRALVQAGLQAQAALAQASLRDPLTGAYNRRALDFKLDALLRQARERHQPLAVLALDLDGFKAVNDGHGHAAGDAALREVVARLHAAVGEADLVARTGGDEFVIALQPGTDEAAAQAVGRRLMQALAEPVALPGGSAARLGVSVGVALCPREGAGARALLEAADAACCAAKRGGKNRVEVAGPAGVGRCGGHRP